MTCFLESFGGFDGSGSEQTEITSLLPKDSAPVSSWGGFGQDEDGLDDSLLEPSEGEEDDGHFSYTEEEIQELLKDDDSLNEQSVGGLQKDAGGETEKLGGSSYASLDSPQDINVLCSLGPRAGPDSVYKLPQPVRLDKDSEKKEGCERRLGKVVPLLQAKARSKIQTFSKTELEQKKQIYLKNVIAHLKNPLESNQGTLGELYALMDQVAHVEYQMQNQRWQHPSDLTMRNYPRFRQKPLQRYSLTQWVDRNLRSHCRFQGLADQFQHNHTPVVSSPHL